MSVSIEALNISFVNLKSCRRKITSWVIVERKKICKKILCRYRGPTLIMLRHLLWEILPSLDRFIERGLYAFDAHFPCYRLSDGARYSSIGRDRDSSNGLWVSIGEMYVWYFCQLGAIFLLFLFYRVQLLFSPMTEPQSRTRGFPFPYTQGPMFNSRFLTHGTR